jgi:hypothetical protein
MATMLEDWPRRRLDETADWVPATSALEAEVLDQLEWLHGWEAGASLPSTYSAGQIKLGNAQVLKWGNWEPAGGVSWRQLLDERNSKEQNRMFFESGHSLYRIFLVVPTYIRAQGFLNMLRTRGGASEGLRKRIGDPGNITDPKVLGKRSLRPLYIGETARSPIERLKEHILDQNINRKRALEQVSEGGDPNLIEITAGMRSYFAGDKTAANTLKFQIKRIAKTSGPSLTKPARVAVEHLHIWRERPLLQRIWREK